MTSSAAPFDDIGPRLELTAPAGSDLYRLPGVREIDAVPEVSRTLDGDFTLSVRVAVQGSRFADAGGLLVHTADGWTKACVERAPDGRWSVVTVVSRPESDEAAGPELAGPATELTVAREGRRLAFLHREEAAGDHRFVRTLRIPSGPLRVSLFAQAPFSERCTATFLDLRFSLEPLRDRR
ncbi:regulation of enolase protein 1 (concanavalin A-like superfamily) [Kitasatospora sp. MAP12-15]|uniref:DUF1349 domain-containing protein n=1 Tax=unclassified Kitasatospora TaxID=2633591 RepID=UPI0024744509|nr:DUF1349 domain-containing protein [Kitasatospora sp. MAP12-44]MDH6115452.1 regulation of enolase protein 1 (concanavalin A-like superfamily) [Kitasatospora sp. MAP12-44]